MFIGRSRELEKLEALWQKKTFQLPILYGRRRVGKTALIRQFCQNKKHTIFFTGIESSVEENLESLYTAILQEFPSAPTFSGFSDALAYLFAESVNKQFLLVLDEYPYLAKAYPPISSILQKLIDQYLDRSKLFLILCGSSLSFMEKNLLNAQSPLYGRRTDQCKIFPFKILPFDFFEASLFFPNYTNEDRAAMYGILGGTPHYLIQMDAQSSVFDNVEHKILEPTSFLFEEPINLLKQEIQETAIYNSILTSMARGASKTAEIATKSHVTNEICSESISNLILLELLKKESPFPETRSGKSIYKITDPFFSFWYTYVFTHTSLLQNEIFSLVIDIIKKDFSRYMGQIFKLICRQWLWRQNKKNKLPIPFIDLGRWWGGDPQKKAEVEIDIICKGMNKELIFCECKWSKHPIGWEVYESLRDRARLVPCHTSSYFLFSKSGFTDECKEKASAARVYLIDLDMLTRDIALS